MEKLKDKERTRGANFTEKEERLLIKYVKDYSSIIECKKTDSVSNHQKLEAWKKLAGAFNKDNDRFRSVEALKNKYENLKKKCKKVFAAEKASQFGTGGGPYKKIEITDVDLELKEILKTRVTGLTSQYDCDSEDLVTDDETLFNISNVENVAPMPSDHDYSINDEVMLSPTESDFAQMGNENIFNTPSTSKEVTGMELSITDEMFPATRSQESDDNVQSTLGCGRKFSASSLRNSKSKVLKASTTSNIKEKARARPADPLKTKLGQWASAKNELVEIQKKLLIEEHKEKLKLMNNKHQVEIRHMEELHKAQMATLLGKEN